jgi:hypothetical protein
MNEQNLYFGWNAKDLANKTGVAMADLVALGHTTATNVKAIAGALAILGANSPRPARMKKLINPGTTSPSVQESVSTFVAYDQKADALALGWKPAGAGKILPTVRQNSRTVTAGAAVDFGGGVEGYYLFSMNAADAVLPQIEALGLNFAGSTLSDAEIRKGFTGTSQPRPFKATLELEGGSTLSSFCSYDKVTDAANAGWSIAGGVDAPL